MSVWQKTVTSLVASCLCLSVTVFPQDAEVEITEPALNQLLTRLGNVSDGGVYQPAIVSWIPGIQTCDFIGYLECPRTSMPGAPGTPGVPIARCRTAGGGVFMVPTGDPFTYQWWVTDAHFTIDGGAMSLTATVRSRVALHLNDPVSRTVPAALAFDGTSHRLGVAVSDFKVPVTAEFNGSRYQVAEVDVARLMSVAIPLYPHGMQVPLPDGTTRVVTGRVTGVTSVYESGKVRVRLNVAFQ